MTIRVAIIEDNRELRDSLYWLIRGTPGYTCVGAWDGLDFVLERMEDARPDVVLMDLGLPGASGIEGVRRIKSRFPHIEVLILTIYEDDRSVFESLCAGASGYLLKKATPAEILEAIREVHTGGAPMTPQIARKVMKLFQQFSPPPASQCQLTPREQEVLAALVQGMSYKMIAHHLGISIHTVRSHIKRIYEKLHVHSKSQAVAKALRERLV